MLGAHYGPQSTRWLGSACLTSCSSASRYHVTHTAARLVAAGRSFSCLHLPAAATPVVRRMGAHADSSAASQGDSSKRSSRRAQQQQQQQQQLVLLAQQLSASAAQAARPSTTSKDVTSSGGSSSAAPFRPWRQQDATAAERTAGQWSSSLPYAGYGSPSTKKQQPLRSLPLSAQQQAVVDADHLQHRVLLAVAGSGKTEVLVQAALRGFLGGKNVLLLTKITSVTEEIMSRLHEYDPTIELGKTNSHWTHHTATNSIGVANFDAMVHENLKRLLEPAHLATVGSQYKHKVRLLTERLAERQEQPVFMKGPKHHGRRVYSGRPVDLLLIDEFQDLTDDQVALVMEQKASSPGMQTVVVGDILQTLFDKSIVEGSSSADFGSSSSSSSSSSSRSSELVVATAGVLTADPTGTQQAPGGLAAMQLWLQQPGITRFDLDTCWRCPADHVAMVNAVMRLSQEAHGCNALVAARPLVANATPFFFHHPPLTGSDANDHAAIAARQVIHLINSYKKIAPDLRDENIAVLSIAQSNGNPVFDRLKRMPEFEHFVTKDEVASHTINWQRAVGKTVLLSVHGDKGRGHRLVIVLDASARCLPHASRVGRPEELVDMSLLNVALTRSTQFLAVGINAGAPSPYLAPLLWAQGQQQQQQQQQLPAAGIGAASGIPAGPDKDAMATSSQQGGTSSSSSGGGAMPKVWCSWHDHPRGSLAAQLAKVQDPEYLPGTPVVLPAWAPLLTTPELDQTATQKALQVSNHIAHGFEHPGDILPQWRLYKRHQTRFAKPIQLWGSDISASYHSELGVVAGLLSELCVQRMLLWDAPSGRQGAYNQRAEDLLDVYRYLQYTKLHTYTHNNKLLDLAADHDLNEPLLKELNEWDKVRPTSSSSSSSRGRRKQPRNVQPQEVWPHVSAAALGKWVNSLYDIRDRLSLQLRDAVQRQRQQQQQLQQQQQQMQQMQLGQPAVQQAAGGQPPLPESSALQELKAATATVDELLLNPNHPRLLLHPLVKDKKLQGALKEFLSAKPTVEVLPVDMWRLALAKRQLHDPMRKPLAEELARLAPREAPYHQLLQNAAGLVNKLAAHSPEKLTPAFRAFTQQPPPGAQLSTRALLETKHEVFIILKRDASSTGSSSSRPGQASGSGASGGQQVQYERYKIAGRSDIILEHSTASTTASSKRGSSSRSSSSSSSSMDVSSGGSADPAYRHLLEMKCPMTEKEDVEQMWVNQALAYALLSDRHIHQISVVDMHAGVLYTWAPVPLPAPSPGQAGNGEGVTAAAAGPAKGRQEDAPGVYVWPWAPISKQHRLSAMYNIAEEFKWREEKLLRALAGQVIRKAEAANRWDGVP